ncbi:MAG: LysR family transcriptional regulator [Anaerolineae bacterium]|nr:MAG: LysR family transcriptional regulator [Anaerolineae bacterium]
MALTFQEIEVFLTVADQGSFSKAARLLNLSQPSVSQIIQTLESRLQSELFIRHRRGVQLSDAGETLLPMAQELLTTARRLEENMSVLHGTVMGRVLVGCSTSSGKYLLPRLIASFRQQFPAVRVDVLVRGRQSVIEKLLAGQVAFGVSSKKIDHHDLEYLPFFEDEIVLIVPARHPWAKFGCVYTDDLLDIPLILREDDAGTTESVYRGLLEHDITPDMLNVVMQLGNAEAILLAVEEEIGAAFVSRLIAQRGIALGRVKEISITGMTLQRSLHIARNLHFPMTRSQAELWKFFQLHLAELVRVYSSSSGAALDTAS